MASGKLTFVSSLQRGMAAGHGRTDVTDPGKGEKRAVAQVQVTFAGNDSLGNSQTAIVGLSLVGPGDITGLDPGAVVRVFPERDDNDAEAGHFAMVEFDQADLLWRYTPAGFFGDAEGEDATDKLRPWMTLLVLEEGADPEEFTLRPASLSQKLPVLSTKRSQLPDLSQAWAWAHLQVNEVAEDNARIENAVAGKPGRVVARLMCPRVLNQKRAYHAFLVPTFRQGVLAGLGQDPAMVPDMLDPAWPIDDDLADEDIKLPVYYDWRFQTGEVGTFATMAQALEPQVLPATIGRRDLEVTDPGLGLPSPVNPEPPETRVSMSMSGALQSPAAAELPPVTPEDDWVGGLAALIAGLEEESEEIPKVAPPLYGRWYAAHNRLDPPTATKQVQWLYDLNSDPRDRVAAALGTEVIQREQQSLMDSAWRQNDMLRTINYARKILQGARGALERAYERHLLVGSVESRLGVTGPVHAHIAGIHARFAGSQMGREFFDPRYRRLVAPGSVIGRALGLSLVPPNVAIGMVEQVNNNEILLAPKPVPNGALVSNQIWGSQLPAGPGSGKLPDIVRRIGKEMAAFIGFLAFWVARHLLVHNRGRYWWLLHRVLRAGLRLLSLATDSGGVRGPVINGLRIDSLNPGQILELPRPPGFVVIPGMRVDTLPKIPPADPGDTQAGKNFQIAWENLLRELLKPPVVPPALKPVNLGGILVDILEALKPGNTLPQSQAGRVFTHPSVPWQNDDPLEPILAAPTFDRPMAEPLRKISEDWILPGVGDVPRNSFGLVETNQRFVEAYMTGLNHEMTRELIWNEYAVDQRGTYFRQFWDSRGFVSTEKNARAGEDLLDIKPIHTWADDAALGGNSPRPNGDRAVFLVRGELIKRYPNVIIYAATKVEPPPDRDEFPDAEPDPDYEERHPVFRGFLGGDLAYYGFDLTVEELRKTVIVGDKEVPKWWFILQEQPAEPKFGIDEDELGTFTDRYADVEEEFDAETAAQVADTAIREYTRVAVGATTLLPAETL